MRLEANVHRIAAFEDGLSIQHAATLENAVRPATRASQVKATHSMQVEPVSVESDQSKIRTEDDSIEGAHVQEIVESDASCADDLDYVESKSEGPLTVCRCVAFCTLSLLMVTRIPMAKMKTLRRLALNTAARRFLSSVKLERILKLTVMWSRGQMTRAMRPQTLVNISILTHTCKSLIPCPTALSLQTSHRVPSAKRLKTSDANSLYACPPNANSHHSTRGPLQNANGGENDCFNLDYSGILDEDMQEVALLPVKPAQVKVCV